MVLTGAEVESVARRDRLKGGQVSIVSVTLEGVLGAWLGQSGDGHGVRWRVYHWRGAARRGVGTQDRGIAQRRPGYLDINLSQIFRASQEVRSSVLEYISSTLTAFSANYVLKKATYDKQVGWPIKSQQKLGLRNGSDEKTSLFYFSKLKTF